MSRTLGALLKSLRCFHGASRPFSRRARVPLRLGNPLHRDSLSRPQHMRLAWKAQSRTNTTDASKEIPREDKYQIYFTCKPCLHRSGHQISKHGYHRGSVLITCPNCSVRHVITDHMKIFLDAGGDLESILRDKGEKIRRGSVAENGDIEMWDDHSTMRRPRLPELTDTESNNHVNMRKPQVPPRMPEGNESN